MSFEIETEVMTDAVMMIREIQPEMFRMLKNDINDDEKIARVHRLVDSFIEQFRVVAAAIPDIEISKGAEEAAAMPIPAVESDVLVEGLRKALATLPGTPTTFDVNANLSAIGDCFDSMLPPYIYYVLVLGDARPDGITSSTANFSERKDAARVLMNIANDYTRGEEDRSEEPS